MGTSVRRFSAIALTMTPLLLPRIAAAQPSPADEEEPRRPEEQAPAEPLPAPAQPTETPATPQPPEPPAQPAPAPSTRSTTTTIVTTTTPEASLTTATRTSKHVHRDSIGEPYAASEKEEEEAEGEPKGFPTYNPAQGFHIASDDGNYNLRFGFAGGFKIEPSWIDGESERSRLLAFVRPSFRGHFFRPWIGYSVAWELAADAPFLLGANIDLKPIDEFGFRFGQQGTPVSRHTSTAVQNIFFPDYSGVAGYFWSGRQRGATAYGSLLDGKIDYWAGAYGSSTTSETVLGTRHYIGEGRLTFNPLGPVNPTELPFTPGGDPLPFRFSFTLQGYHGKMERDRASTAPTNSPLAPTPVPALQNTTTTGADVWVQWDRLIVSAEYYYRWLASLDAAPAYRSQGLWGQAIVNAYANKIGLGARFGWIDPSSELSHDNAYEAEGQVAWFIRPSEFSLKLRYGYVKQQAPNAADLAGKSSYFGLPYGTGDRHLVTLQATLVF